MNRGRSGCSGCCWRGAGTVTPPEADCFFSSPNLISNSIRYGNEGGTSVLKLEDLGHAVRISVIDDGIGIRADDQQRIFERFYRVDRSRSRDAGGSGLGLAIVKHIIESHGQSIQVQSNSGEGTTFSWELVNLDWEAEKLNLTVKTPVQS